MSTVFIIIAIIIGLVSIFLPIFIVVAIIFTFTKNKNSSNTDIANKIKFNLSPTEKHCEYCGSVITENTDKCENCGAPLIE